MPFITSTPYWATINEMEEIICRQIHHFSAKQDYDLFAENYQTFREID
jgi:hypothetical protein